jgi:hypothetical protein
MALGMVVYLVALYALRSTELRELVSRRQLSGDRAQ